MCQRVDVLLDITIFSFCMKNYFSVLYNQFQYISYSFGVRDQLMILDCFFFAIFTKYEYFRCDYKENNDIDSSWYRKNSFLFIYERMLSTQTTVWVFNIFFLNLLRFNISYLTSRDGRGRDHMVVGFTMICGISAYHHLRCEFKSCSWRGVLDIMKYCWKWC